MNITKKKVINCLMKSNSSNCDENCWLNDIEYKIRDDDEYSFIKKYYELSDSIFLRTLKMEPDDSFDLSSCSKSFLSCLMGIDLEAAIKLFHKMREEDDTYFNSNGCGMPCSIIQYMMEKFIGFSRGERNEFGVE